MIDLTVPGVPRGKGRPKFVKATGRAYTDKETVRAEQAIQQAWETAGSPVVEGPLELHLTAVFERPQHHWKKGGELSASGVRSWWPTKRPDLDNAIKLGQDAISGFGFGDDAQIVHIVAWKRWANPGERAHWRIRLKPLVGP